MNKEMNIFGIGKRLGLPVIMCLIVLIIIGFNSHNRFEFKYGKNFTLIGGTLIILGLFLSFKAGFRMVRAFKENKLLTDGLYGITKNPMYLSHIIFTIPGLSLFFNNYLILILIPMMVVLVKKMISVEEEYLQQNFPIEYEEYRKKVLIKFI